MQSREERTLSLGQSGCSKNVLDYKSMKDPLENIIDRFKNHPSIIAINEKIIADSFDFRPFTEDEVPTKIFKMNEKESTTYSSSDENTEFMNCRWKFPNGLKLADKTPIFRQ